MENNRLIIAGLGSCILIVGVCFAFVTRSSNATSEMTSRISEPQLAGHAHGKEVSGYHSAELISAPNTRAENGASSIPSDLDEQIASLSEKVDQLGAQTAELAAAQWRLEALMRNLTTIVDNSGLKVPTYEEHEQALAKIKTEVQSQRKIVEDLHNQACAIARKFGLDESTAVADIAVVTVLPPGRNYSELTEARAKFINAKRSLEATELRFSEMRMMDTRAPVGQER